MIPDSEVLILHLHCCQNPEEAREAWAAAKGWKAGCGEWQFPFGLRPLDTPGNKLVGLHLQLGRYPLSEAAYDALLHACRSCRSKVLGRKRPITPPREPRSSRQAQRSRSRGSPQRKSSSTLVQKKRLRPKAKAHAKLPPPRASSGSQAGLASDGTVTDLLGQCKEWRQQKADLPFAEFFVQLDKEQQQVWVMVLGMSDFRTWGVPADPLPQDISSTTYRDLPPLDQQWLEQRRNQAAFSLFRPWLKSLGQKDYLRWVQLMGGQHDLPGYPRLPSRLKVTEALTPSNLVV